MSKVIHIIGNGDNAVMFDHKSKGLRLVCNLPPFAVDKVYASVMVDFKMMAALTEGSLQLDAYWWVLGNRPKIWMDQKPGFYMKHANHIREFYLTVPKYCGPVGSPQAATNFNCGHMATHYAANKLKGEEIHMYGFDSIFDHNMRSVTDLYLNSDRGDTNNYRLLNNWRPIWTNIFNEFPDTQFVLYHKHDKSKIKLPENVEVVTKK
jgi:hypothetical protein